MTSMVKRELYTVLTIGAVLLLLLGYTVGHARAAVRDDLRKQDITNIKRALEQYNNKYNFYVTPPSLKAECTKSSKESWFFGDRSPLLQKQFIDAIPHDVRESKGFTYLYCVSHIEKNRATGFYLEASLEGNATEGVFFDEDEQRKFGYRVLDRNGKKLYRVCGGDEDQCNQQEL